MEKLTLAERIERLPREVVGEHVPPPELVAFNVIVSRNLRNWKQSTLADFAGVSTSTIERIERGGKVRPAQLDKVAMAFGHEAGYFTAPRCQRPIKDAVTSMVEDWGHMVPVDVARITTQPQVRKLVGGHALLIHSPDCAEIEDDLHGLAEWMDLGSYLFSSLLPPDQKELAGRRREFYRDVLAAVRAIEAQGYTVLAGQLTDAVDGTTDWRITVLSVTPKSIDPAASKRKIVFIDKRDWGARAALKEGAVW